MFEIEKTIRPQENKQKNKEESRQEKKEEKESPEYLKVKESLSLLKDKKLYQEDPQKYKELSYQVYKDLGSFLIESGGEFASDVNNVYKKYQNNFDSPLVVRREDPEKVLSLANGKDIDLSFDSKVAGDRGDKYANSAIWPYGKNPTAGLKNAFLEGRGMAGPLVTLTAIKPNKEKTNLSIPENHKIKVGDIEREAVRIFSGKISKEDLKFIILRIQKDFFPIENLTEEEKKSNLKQIFRAVEF